MKLTFIGAAHEVTGSCSLLEVNGQNVLIDYGMEQGQDTYVNIGLPIAPGQVDMVILTHAHIDHAGLLPLLYRQGFRGKVHATTATCQLCDIMLRDSAHIQMFEAEWRNRKARRSGGEGYVPLYEMEDAEGVLELFCPHPYGSRFTAAPGVDVRFVDAGHLLGSSSIELWLTEEDQERKIVFSGDIGNTGKPILNDPQYILQADYVVMESTYGDRSHGEKPDYITALTQVLQETFDRGGSVVIPSFAVGRTQELLYFLHKIRRDGLIQGHDDFPVYLDSPLAIEATHIYRENMLGNFDEEAMEMVHRGENPLTFPGLITTVTAEESKAINFDERCKVILSASGMCEAGRIRHHLKHNLWRRENTILFVGYQAKNTLGRALFDGAKRVRLFGEDIQVNAHIKSLAGISGHADVDGLIRWLQYFSPKPRLVFVQHGEAQVCEQFAERLRTQLHYAAEAPYSGSSYDLLNGAWAHLHPPVLVPVRRGKQKPSPAMARLKAALQRLTDLVERSQGRANKDLARLADRIQELCDKWEK